MKNPGPHLLTSEQRLGALRLSYESLQRLTVHVDWKYLEAHQRLTSQALAAYKQAQEDHERDPSKLYPLF